MVLSMFYRLVLANFLFSLRDINLTLVLLLPRRHVVWRDSVGVESSRSGLKSECADIFHQSFLWLLRYTDELQRGRDLDRISYLRNRMQTCLVNCNKSSETYLPCGVPQGTILGPLLFLLYINDLPNCLVHSQPRMYADDTSITYASNVVGEIERCVNIDLDRIRIWLAANKLTLNTTKTEFLLIGSRQRLSTLERNPKIEINKFPIKHVSTSKSLGVHIDGNLSWECHINEISKKIASGISAIKRIRYFLPFEILLNVYNSLVQPHFDYCNVVCGNCSKNLSSKLQKLQNRAARVLTFSNYDCSTSELFQNLKWSKLVHQRAVCKAIMMHSIVNNTAPEYLTSRFVRRCDLTSYNLREN